MRYLIIILCIIFSVGCNNTDHQTVKTEKKYSSVRDNNPIAKSGLGVEPTLKSTDSVEIIYYDDPDGDSLRYTRFYHYFSSNDSALIGTVLSNLGQNFQTRNEPIKCRSEGKIHLYKQLDPVKTVYFSTRCDTCCYLYFIKDGAFLYFPISENMKRSLKENKANTKKP